MNLEIGVRHTPSLYISVAGDKHFYCVYEQTLINEFLLWKKKKKF